MISASLGCIDATVPLPVARSLSCRKRVVLPASQGPTIKTDAPRGPEAKRRKIAEQWRNEKVRKNDVGEEMVSLGKSNAERRNN